MANQYGEAYQSHRRDRDGCDAAIHERMVALVRYSLATTGLAAALDTELAPVGYVDCFDLHPKNIQEFNL